MPVTKSTTRQTGEQRRWWLWWWRKRRCDCSTFTHPLIDMDAAVVAVLSAARSRWSPEWTVEVTAFPDLVSISLARVSRSTAAATLASHEEMEQRMWCHTNDPCVSRLDSFHHRWQVAKYNMLSVPEVNCILDRTSYKNDWYKKSIKIQAYELCPHCVPAADICTTAQTRLAQDKSLTSLFVSYPVCKLCYQSSKSWTLSNMNGQLDPF